MKKKSNQKNKLMWRLVALSLIVMAVLNGCVQTTKKSTTTENEPEKQGVAKADNTQQPTQQPSEKPTIVPAPTQGTPQPTQELTPESTKAPPKEPEKKQESQLNIGKIAPSTKMSFKQLVSDDGTRGKPPTNFPPKSKYKLEIDLTNNILKVFDSNNNPVRLMLCTTGKADTPTPKGTFSVGPRKERFAYFNEFECYAQYWTQVFQGIFIHSVLYDERDVSTLKKSSYRNLGKSTSHGCVRLSVPDAKWIYENIAPGTKVLVHNAPKDEVLKKMLALAPLKTSSKKKK